MSEYIARRVRIFGRVQGVGFRDWLSRVATRENMEGWVRNRSGGSVEAHLQGSVESIAKVLLAAQRGPPHARVDRVAVEESPATLDIAKRGFERLPTMQD